MTPVRFQKAISGADLVIFAEHIEALQQSDSDPAQSTVYVGIQAYVVKGSVDDVMALIHGAAKQKEQA
jgi:hypothetical protein